MGDEKDSWKVKTLDEILQEKKRRKEQEEKAEIKRMKNVIRFHNVVPITVRFNLSPRFSHRTKFLLSPVGDVPVSFPV